MITVPGTATEELVAGVWREMLDLDELDVTEDFFELGGHSMLAVQVVFRLTEATGVELDLEDFFDLGTVREVSAAIDRLRDGGGDVVEGEL